MRIGLLAGAMAAGLAWGSVALSEPDSQGLLSITFDDASLSQHDLGLRAARDHGLAGTLFVTTKYADEATPNADGWYMGWAEIRAFRRAGWEIGSHSHTHVHLPQLDDSQVIAELDTSKSIIKKRTGIAPVSFAPPFGDFDARTAKLILTRYRHLLLAWGGNRGRNPMHDVNPGQIGRLNVSSQDSPQKVCGAIEEAAAGGIWLVLMFHEFVAQAPGEYQYGIGDFRSILACAKRLQDAGRIRVVTVADAMELLRKD
ncbi:MAG: polysaccharide deacetylase family protein [Paracoccaceae bacterium]|nr:polysaccharide deacetylase family protein [Paracoccaceae bacterium]